MRRTGYGRQPGRSPGINTHNTRRSHVRAVYVCAMRTRSRALCGAQCCMHGVCTRVRTCMGVRTRTGTRAFVSVSVWARGRGLSPHTFDAGPSGSGCCSGCCSRSGGGGSEAGCGDPRPAARGAERLFLGAASDTVQVTCRVELS